MARVVNEVLTKSRTEGFDQTGKQIEELSKKQTRLANDSANTARAFSAQASGLGGLVAAYAGAAATTFALQQSFSALSAAARAQAVVEGITSLAQSLGQNGPKMISTLKEITRGQLSTAESAQNIGIALSAGLGESQIEQLADIATRASKVLGRDLTDSIQRLVRGVGKLEPELLDELGIFTRIEPAVERYAARLGKASSSLTNFERRQAFANAVIEEGSSKYRNVDTTLTDSSQNLNKLAANLTDLATKIGQTLVNIFDPIVTFLNKDITNLAGLLVLLGTLIFSKLGQVTRQGIEGFTKNIDTLAANVTEKLTKSSKTAEVFTGRIIEAQRAAVDVTSLRSFAGPRAEAAETRTAIRRIREGNIAPSEIPALRAALQKTIASESALNTPASQTRLEGLQRVVAKLGEASDAASPKVNTLGRAITGVGTAVSFVAGKIGGFLGLLGNIAMGYAIIDFFATLLSIITGIENPLNRMLVGIGKIFSDLVDRFTQTRRANEAFLSSFTEGENDIRKSASSLEIYNKALQQANDIFAKSARSAPENRTSLGGEESGVGITQDTRTETQRLRLGREKSFNDEIEKLNKQFLKSTSIFEQEQLLLTRQLLEQKRDAYFKFFDAVEQSNRGFTEKMEQTFTELSIQIKNKLGIGFQETAQLFKDGLITIDEQNNITIKLLDSAGNVVSKISRSLEDIKNKGFDPVAQSSLQVETNIRKLSRALEDGSVSADVLAGFVANLQKELDSLEIRAATNPSISGYVTRINQAIQKFTMLKDEIVRTEQVQKDLNEVFGNSIKLVGSLVQTGIVGGAGLAVTPEQQKTNQLYYLQSIQGVKKITDLTEQEKAVQKEINTLQKAGVSETAERLISARAQLLDIRNQLAIASNINKAFLGEFISFAIQIDSVYRTEQKRTLELNNQLELLQFQNGVAERLGKEELRQLQARLDLEKKRLDLEVKSVQTSLQDKRFENAKLTLDLAIQENDRVKQRLELEQELKNVRAESSKLAIARSAQPGLLAMQRDLTLMQTFGLGSEKSQENLQLQLQIREKEVELNQTYEDIRIASEKNLSAAILDKGSADLRVEIAKTELQATKERSKAELSKFQAEFALRKDELEERKKSIEASKQTLADTWSTTMMQIRHDETIYNLELEINRQRIEQINKQKEIFEEHTEALALIFASEVASRRITPTMDSAERAAVEQASIREFTDIVGATMGRVTSITSLQSSQEAAMRQMFEARRAAAGGAYARGISRADTEIAGITQQQARLDDLKKKQEELIRLEGELAEKRAQGVLDTAEAEQKLANLRFDIRKTELSNEVERLKQTQDRQKAELELLKQIAALKGDNLFVALADSISIFRNQTTEFITTMLTDVMNGTKKAGDVFKSFMLNLALEIQKTIVRRTISEPIANGIADLFGGALKGSIGTGGIMSYIPGTSSYTARLQGEMISSDKFATPAIGGEIKRMAVGGSAGLRDSVPALLQPGEFVIRRPSAMAIGGQTLNHMNSTGQVPAGNVMVNVNNQGTPQTVQGTPKVTRQGENLVVDIIVKDIQNNGPIRQTLRGMR